MFTPTAHITLYQRNPGLDCNAIDPQQQLDTTGTNHGNKKRNDFTTKSTAIWKKQTTIYYIFLVLLLSISVGFNSISDGFNSISESVEMESLSSSPAEKSETKISSSSMTTNEHHQQEQSAFCLLIKDDNDILSEWIAYHYSVFNMRRLIVAVDPSSEQNPVDVLQFWGEQIQTISQRQNNRGNNIDISSNSSDHSKTSIFELKYTIWNDEDYTPEYFYKNKNYDKIPVTGDSNRVKKNKIKNHNKTTGSEIRIIKTLWHSPSEITSQNITQTQIKKDLQMITSHRFRQNSFISECYRQIIAEQSDQSEAQHGGSKQQNYYWTVHIDTDEYLVPNPLIHYNYTNTNKENIIDDEKFLLDQIIDIFPEQPSQNSLWDYFVKFLAVNHKGRHIDYRKGCTMMPRLKFGSKIDDTTSQQPRVNTSTDTTGVMWNHKNFESLRWKYHANFIGKEWLAGGAKAIMDVSRLDLRIDDIFKRHKFESLYHENGMHRTIQNLCQDLPRSFHTSSENKVHHPLAVYHYLGSKQRFTFRKDPRRTESAYMRKNKDANYAKGDDNNGNAKSNQSFRWWIGGWLDQFIDTYGINNTMKVLGGELINK